MSIIRSEDSPVYGGNPAGDPANARYEHPEFTCDDDVLVYAQIILRSRLRQPGQVMSAPREAVRYLQLELAEEEREVFAVLWMDNRHQLIEFERLFYGTIDGASVHPREVVKAALKHNAASLILAHNHPSGIPEPSRADIAITKRLTDALGLVDVRVLDHIIIGGMDHVSFADRGML